MKASLLFLLLLVPVCAVPSFQKFYVLTDVGLSQVWEELRITLTDDTSPIDTFNYTVGFDPGTVYAEVAGKSAAPEVSSTDGTWEISVPLNGTRKTDILLRFRSDALVRFSDRYDFSFRYDPQYFTEEFRLRVVLPAGGMLAEKRSAAQTVPVVFPDAGISSDGRRIAVEWNGQNVTTEKVFLMTFELPERPKEQSRWWLWLIPILIVLFAVYTVNVRWQSSIEVLKPEERAILSEVRKTRGISAKDIVSRTKLTKVKIFRITQRLQNSNLIKVEKSANRTRLYLSDKLETVLNPVSSIKHFLVSLVDKLTHKKVDKPVLPPDKDEETETEQIKTDDTKEEHEEYKDENSDDYTDDSTDLPVDKPEK